MREKWGKKVSRSKEARNDMEEMEEGKKVRRIFTAEQKFEILKDIERCKTIKEGLAKDQLAQSVYHKWKRQLAVGVRASLRNSRPLKPVDLKRAFKSPAQIEPYQGRATPWKSPRYEVWQRNLMWGSDWTKLSVGGVRWYLLTVIDFFSRWIIAWEAVPTVHAGNVKAIYHRGLNSQGISIHSDKKPELRVDRGSPNTSATENFKIDVALIV